MYFKLIQPQSQHPTYITSILPNTRLHDIGRLLRNSSIQTLPMNRITSFQNSFVPATTKLWNALPIHIRNETSTKSFKKALVKHLGTPPPPHYFIIGTKAGIITPYISLWVLHNRVAPFFANFVEKFCSTRLFWSILTGGFQKCPRIQEILKNFEVAERLKIWNVS